jgi:hypothetical protein
VKVKGERSLETPPKQPLELRFHFIAGHHEA